MTIKQTDVARVCGLSRTTVEFALHPRLQSRVRPETRARVQKTAKELGYVPHALARGLRGGRTHAVGILWGQAGPSRAIHVVRNVAMHMQQRGYASSLADHMGDPPATRHLLADFAARKVDGVILQGTTELLSNSDIVNQLRQFPAVTLVAANDWNIPFDLVVQDRSSAVREVVDHFVEMGRRRIAFVGVLQSNQSKIAPLRTRAEERGHWIGNEDLVDVPLRRGQDIEEENLLAALDARWPGQPDCDAMLCSNDFVAASVMGWLRRKGVRVPDDLALVGFDNDPFAQYITPPLASVERRDERVVELLEAMMLRRLENKDLPPQRERVEMEFVRRESADAKMRNPEVHHER